MNLIVSKGKKAVAYLSAIDPVLYLILFFCLAGLLRNLIALAYHGFDYSTVATKVFVAMSVIYFAQIILILLRERNAWVVSALQAFFCFYVYEDFTALPLANVVKMIFGGSLSSLDYGWIYFINMVLISAMFSFELLKTYLIYVLTAPLPSRNKKQKNEAAAEQI